MILKWKLYFPSYVKRKITNFWRAQRLGRLLDKETTFRLISLRLCRAGAGAKFTFLIRRWKSEKPISINNGINLAIVDKRL